jgi:hypothetical protein
MRKTSILAAGCGLFASVAFAQTPPAATGAPAAQDFVGAVPLPREARQHHQSPW